MENLINRLVIRNFKSIQHIDLACKRVNVFIGEPNVGKSNILEAMALLGFGYSQNEEKYLSDLVRYQNFSDLFFDKDKRKIISIETDLGVSFIWKGLDGFHIFNTEQPNRIPNILTGLNKLLQQDLENAVLEIYNDLSKTPHFHKVMHENMTFSFPTEASKIGLAHNVIIEQKAVNVNNYVQSIVRRYEFIKDCPKDKEMYNFLQPPYGNNLFSIIANNKEIWKEAKDRFEKYKLNLVYKQHENIFEIQKNVDGFVTDYPYQNMADTLQRIIFYLAAIESNKNSVLVFEEPEAHAFPPYTAELADRIALDDENQYFLTTHSPYLLNTLLSALGNDELNLVLVYYEDYETKVKTLNQEEIKEAISDNFNLFFNLNKFLYAKEELHD